MKINSALFYVLVIFVIFPFELTAQPCIEVERRLRSSIAELTGQLVIIGQQLNTCKNNKSGSAKPCPPCDVNCKKAWKTASHWEWVASTRKGEIDKYLILIKTEIAKCNLKDTTINKLVNDVSGASKENAALRDTIVILRDTIVKVKERVIECSKQLSDCVDNTKELIEQYNKHSIRIIIEYKRPLDIGYRQYLVDNRNSDLGIDEAIKARWVKRIIFMAEFYSEESAINTKGSVILSSTEDKSKSNDKIPPETIEYDKKDGEVGRYHRYSGAVAFNKLPNLNSGRYVYKIDFQGNISTSGKFTLH